LLRSVNNTRLTLNYSPTLSSGKTSRTNPHSHQKQDFLFSTGFQHGLPTFQGSHTQHAIRNVSSQDISFFELTQVNPELENFFLSLVRALPRYFFAQEEEELCHRQEQRLLQDQECFIEDQEGIFEEHREATED
jgi:hypothetical protein